MNCFIPSKAIVRLTTSALTCKEVDADDRMLCYAVLNGLNSENKNHVTRSQPNNWKELVDAAKVGEMCVPEASSIESSVTVQLELIKDQLKHHSAQRSPVSAPLSRQDRPLRSPLPRRVCFDDWTDDRRARYDATRREDYVDYADRRMDNGRRLSYYDRSDGDTGYYDRPIPAQRDSSFRGRGMTRGLRYYHPMGPSTEWRNDSYQYQPSRGMSKGRGTFRGSVRPLYWKNSRDRQWPESYGPPCGNCGRRRREHRNMCPAINQDCRGCGKKGHFLRVCRSTARIGIMSD